MTDFILGVEGGYTVDHAGATNYGITKSTYEAFVGYKVADDEIEQMTIGQARMFYRVLYDGHRLHLIKNEQLCLLVFDSIVHSGYRWTAKALQRELDVTVDGIMGPVTFRAVNNKPDIYMSLLYARVFLFARLAWRNEEKYLRYLVGWNKRLKPFYLNMYKIWDDNAKLTES